MLFVEDAELLAPDAETSEAVFAVDAVKAKIAAAAVVAVLHKRAVIQTAAVNGFIAEFGGGGVGAVHAVAAFIEIFAVITVFRVH